ncbi:MAG: bifunctional glutamate N-acetyltransferase/amino-acid acetyltransferase ArgJ [Myxococcota bacterium]|nr:bifunctional glutamate N-acetyltransferase/amino-acid acetyltransferase ArgJ [Myxococcota bacterium]
MSSWTVDGFRCAGVHCGIKKNGKPDLGIIVAEAPVACAGVFTTNIVVAPPVVLSRTHLAHQDRAQAVVINSGNANACTGEQGMLDAIEMAELAAQITGCERTDVQVCSTGVIGAPLPMERIRQGLREATSRLSKSGLPDFADAICTTDTFRKMRSHPVNIGERTIQIAGVSKGAGMIHPNMATMLGVVLTDAPIEPSDLTKIWRRICAATFNAISVDGDTSTNDTALILASGRAGNAPLGGDELTAFEAALYDLTKELALDIVRDAEGGTKVVTITIEGARSHDEARQVAETIALSPLVKTALHGEDPNWGRIVAAAGRSGVQFDPENIRLSIGDATIYEDGRWLGPQAETNAHEVMKRAEYALTIDLRLGTASHSIFTCDLSEQYIRINADYRS